MHCSTIVFQHLCSYHWLPGCYHTHHQRSLPRQLRPILHSTLSPNTPLGEPSWRPGTSPSKGKAPSRRGTSVWDPISYRGHELISGVSMRLGSLTLIDLYVCAVFNFIVNVMTSWLVCFLFKCGVVNQCYTMLSSDMNTMGCQRQFEIWLSCETSCTSSTSHCPAVTYMRFVDLNLGIHLSDSHIP